MADTGSRQRPLLRAPRAIEVVLVLSLALNIFVAGGFAYSEWRAGAPASAPLPERRLAALAERLGIDPETSRPFRELRRAMRDAQEVLQEDNAPLIADAWGELAKPEPDRQRIQELLDQIAANRRQFQSETTAAITRFLSTLTPEQRETMVRIVLDRKDPMGAPMRSSIGK